MRTSENTNVLRASVNRGIRKGRGFSKEESRLSSMLLTSENTDLLRASVNRQHLLRLLTPASGLKTQLQRETDNRYEERSPNRSL